MAYFILSYPGLQLTALVLQCGNLLVFGEECVCVLCQVSCPLPSKRSLVLLYSAGLHGDGGIHLHGKADRKTHVNIMVILLPFLTSIKYVASVLSIKI